MNTIQSFARDITKKVKSWFSKQQLNPKQPMVQTFNVEAHDPAYEPDKVRATKLYADQRQKAVRNRRHKPTKAMRHVYQLR